MFTLDPRCIEAFPGQGILLFPAKPSVSLRPALTRAPPRSAQPSSTSTGGEPCPSLTEQHPLVHADSEICNNSRPRGYDQPPCVAAGGGDQLQGFSLPSFPRFPSLGSPPCAREMLDVSRVPSRPSGFSFTISRFHGSHNFFLGVLRRENTKDTLVADPQQGVHPFLDAEAK